MLPLKYKSWINNKKLSFENNIEPSTITGNEQSINFVSIDNKRIVIDCSSLRFVPLVWAILLFLGAKMFYDEASGDLIFVIVGLTISSILFSLSVVALLWLIFFKKKYVVLDRDKGTVSIPGPFWYKNIEISYKDVVAIVRLENRLYGLAKVLNLYRPDGYRADVGINTHDLEELKRDWAFYCWYMDKSRPLPPSPVFEQYRNSPGDSPAMRAV